MSYYKHHVFFCLNKRDAPEACCACHDSEGMREYAKKRVKELKLNGPGQVRINASGCLDRCELGTTVVIYPEGVWYSVANKEDIEEILQTHVRDGGRVPRDMLGALRARKNGIKIPSVRQPGGILGERRERRVRRRRQSCQEHRRRSRRRLKGLPTIVLVIYVAETSRNFSCAA